MPTQLDSFARKTALGTPEEQRQAWANANGSQEFQQEMLRLRQVLEERERGNYLEVRLVRGPGLVAEFLFNRNGPETLARYTSNPAFRGVSGGAGPDKLRQLQTLWENRFGSGVPITSISTDPFRGMVVIDVGVEEAEFRELARERGWVLDDNVEFSYPAAQPPGFADVRLAQLVRAFAREDDAVGIRLTALGTGRIVLEDGCFRMGGKDGPLVMFARSSQLALDGEGYVTIASAVEGDSYRIGEAGAWGGPNGVDEKSKSVKALHKACGNGPIVNVAAPKSERLFALPYPLWVLDYAYTKGITYDAAWGVVIACLEKQERSGRTGLDARDRCIQQYNGWNYIGDALPPPPGR